MGCCLSTLEENKPKPKSSSNPLEKTHQFSCVSKSPPRPEEETVKEVLSETPKPKPEPESESESELEIKVAKIDEEPTKSDIVVSPKKPFLEEKKHNPDPSTPEVVSEVSEICSLSETISNTTLEENQQQQWAVKDSATSRVYRSQGHNGNLPYNNKNNNNHNVQLRRNHGRSPVRPGRADPSPPRRRYPGPGLGSGQVGPKREVGGENSTRRSRSPATRSNAGRSSSGRRAGPSPGRVRMVHGPESVGKVEENENEKEGMKESLENPLVSLECFIFL